MKHDIPYASLQRIIPDVGEPSHTLDAAWNPRNKYLADHLFVIDGICGMKTGTRRRECVPEAASDHSILETLLHVGWWVPKVNHFGVSFINNKRWPITKQDVTHAKQNLEYVSCDAPRVSSVNVSNRSGRNFDTSWILAPGCTGDVAIRSYRFCYDVHLSFVGIVFPTLWCKSFESSPATFTLPRGWNILRLNSMWIEVNPVDSINGLVSYPKVYFPTSRRIYPR